MDSTSIPDIASAAREGDAEREYLATNEVLRDITRGGLAGLIVGVLLAGIGGRLVMRLAAVLVPEAVGGLTENGNRIGTITLGGSLGLIIAVGLLFGAMAGSIWVVIAPWMPRARGARMLASIPVAIAVGARGLVSDTNLDFVVLGRDPLVVASLVVLVALFGPALVIAERWLDRRLPHAGVDDGRVVAAYAIVAALGSFLTVFLVVPAVLGSDLTIAGIALVVVGLSTAASWWLRIVRVHEPDRRLTSIAQAGLVVAVVAGLVVTVREVDGILL